MLKKDNKKAHISDDLAVNEIQALQSANADQHRDRITRFATLKHRAKNQENYLFTLAKFKENYEKDVKNEESIKALKSAQKLNECGNYLLFKNFYTIGEVKLSKLRTCGQHLLCPFCAAIRASRAIQKYVERIDQVLKENRKLKPVLITLTVKNGSNLAERSEHLMKSFRTLLERRRDYEKKGRGFNEFCKVQGAMYSYENTFNEKQANGIRIFICLHWLTSGLINKNFQNTGTVLLAILWLLMSVGLREKRDMDIAKLLLKFVNML